MSQLHHEVRNFMENSLRNRTKNEIHTGTFVYYNVPSDYQVCVHIRRINCQSVTPPPKIDVNVTDFSP